MYITLEEYLELGGEKVTDANLFDRLERKAWYVLDQRTQGRIKEPLENIKRLMVELIDLEHDRDIGVKQVSNDGVSVTYTDAITYSQNVEQLVSAT